MVDRHTSVKHVRALASAAVAALGLWLIASEFLDLARLSRWYDSTGVLRAASADPDFDIHEGYDAVFGSRFVAGGGTIDYPFRNTCSTAHSTDSSGFSSA